MRETRKSNARKALTQARRKSPRGMVMVVVPREEHAAFADMLNRLKSYENWIETAGQEALDSATRLSGSPRKFYDAFRAALERGPGLRSDN